MSNRLGSGAMFDGIAKRYDLLNRVMSLGLDKGWRRRTVEAMALGENPRVLDLATGTADLAFDVIARHPDARVVGLDPSIEMLRIGADKRTRADLDDRLTFELGDAQRLPHRRNSFDACCMAFGIRNVPDRSKALRELARVTKPGGRIAILELSVPRRGPMAPLARFHIRQVIPRVGALLSGSKEYRYLEESIAAFPPPEEFVAMMEEAGIEVVEARSLTFGACHLFVGEATEAGAP